MRRHRVIGAGLLGLIGAWLFGCAAANPGATTPPPSPPSPPAARKKPGAPPAASPSPQAPAPGSPGSPGPGGVSVGAGAKPAAPSPLLRDMEAQDHAQATAPRRPASSADHRSAKSAQSAEPAQPTAPAEPESSPPAPPHAPPVAAAPPDTEHPVGPAYPVAGMVGQVNGQAIYAADVFKPIHDQLAALGRQLPRRVFQRRARQIIGSQIRQKIIDALILGQAQRNLTENQRRGLGKMVQLHRELLLRKYGRGSEALAQKNLRDKTGQTLDQALGDFRRRAVVSHYMRQKLVPKINVTRRDIERYYDEHHDQFQPPTKRDVRLIRVGAGAPAKRISKRLKAGETFKKVAHDPANTFKRDSGGLVQHLVGAAFGQKPLNKAIARLHAGQHAGPIRIDGQSWYVYVQHVTKPPGRSLLDAQRDIDRRLRTRQFNAMSQRYRARLLKKGSYNDPDQMIDALVKIAVSRFAAGASPGERSDDADHVSTGQGASGGGAAAGGGP